MRVLLNASGAKFGGAKTILDNLIERLNSSSDVTKLFVVCPSNNVNKKVSESDKVEYISLSTSGILTPMYAAIGIAFHALITKPDLIVSLSNVNVIFNTWDRLTYFHQAKIFEDGGSRFKLLRCLIRFQYKNERYVFQTSDVSRRFVSTFGNPRDHCIAWPGCMKLPINEEKRFNGYGLIPYTDCSAAHKNFKFFLRNRKELENIFERIYVTCPAESIPEDCRNFFVGVGHLDVRELKQLYRRASILLSASLLETVGLPVFEFATSGKPAVSLDAEYMRAIEKDLSVPPNILVVDEDGFIPLCYDIVRQYENYCCSDAAALKVISTPGEITWKYKDQKTADYT